MFTVRVGGPDVDRSCPGPRRSRLWLAGVASTVPAALIARTSSVVRADRQALDDVVRLAGAEGRAVERALELAAGSVEAKRKSAVVSIVDAGGAEMIAVSGATTVHA